MCTFAASIRRNHFGKKFSCKYLGVKIANKKQTKLLEKLNPQFFKNTRHLDKGSEEIRNADYVAVTFKSQKNGEIFKQ